MSLKLLYADLREYKDPNFSEQLLGGFLGTSVMLMTLIRSSHKVNFSKERIITFLIRMFLASLHIEVGYIKLISDNINVTIGLHIVICFLLIALDSWKYRHFEAKTPVPAAGSSIKAAGVSNKPLARRGSVYAPQNSAMKNIGRSERASPNAFNPKSSVRRSSMFTHGSANHLLSPECLGPSGGGGGGGLIHQSGGSDSPVISKRPFGGPGNGKRLSLQRTHSERSSSNLDNSPLRAENSIRGAPKRMSSMITREDKIKEALNDFEKSRPNVNIKQVRRSSMFNGGGSQGGGVGVSSGSLRRASSLGGGSIGTMSFEEKLQKEEKEVEPNTMDMEKDQVMSLGEIEMQIKLQQIQKNDEIEEEKMEVGGVEEEVKEGGTMPPVKQESKLLSGVIEGSEDDDDEYDVEYVCYMDEEGNVIEVDEEGHALDVGKGDLASQEYDEEIVEVMYDVDEEDEGYNFDEYSDDEVEVIYEEPDPPKSHITWL